MKKQLELPIETLTALKDAMPSSWATDLSETTGYSRQYIYMIFDGKTKINDHNHIVIQYAQKLVRKAREKKEKEQDKLNKEIIATINRGA